MAVPQLDRVTGILAAGIAIGILLFFKGFRAYRVFRIEEDTPEVPIRSMAMGLVHIHGEAREGSEGIVTSPIGRTPCLYYKVEIDHWEGSSDRGNWRHWKTAWGGTPFTLADSTGEVTIDGKGAEFLVEENTQAVAGGVGGFIALADDPYAPKDPYATPDPYSTPDPAASPANAVADAGSRDPALGPTDAEMVQFAECAPGGSMGGATGYYRLTEYVILAGWSYDIVGTYMDNPDSLEELDQEAAAKDPSYKPPARPGSAATDRKVVGKGKAEPTFVISGDEQKETQENLRHRAVVQVFGGAALAILCLALLLNQMGML